MVPLTWLVCDVVTINSQLYPKTGNLFNAEMIGKIKKVPKSSTSQAAKSVGEVIAEVLKRPVQWPCWWCLFPATRFQRLHLGRDAHPWHDAAHVGNIAVGPGTLGFWKLEIFLWSNCNLLWVFDLQGRILSMKPNFLRRSNLAFWPDLIWRLCMINQKRYMRRPEWWIMAWLYLTGWKRVGISMSVEMLTV